MDEYNTAEMIRPIFYDKTLFLDRLSEIEQIKNTLDSVLQHGDKPRILMFRGSRGLGKTWFSLHLQRTIIPEWKQEHQFEDLKSLWIGLDAIPSQAYAGNDKRQDEHYFFSENTQDTPDTCTHNLLYFIAQHVGATLSQDAGFLQTQWILDRLRNTEKHLILILDSLFEIDWKYLSAIERAILAPLSELSNVILILTGRGPEYNWSTARFRAQPPYILKPFAEEYNPASDTNYISRQLYEQVFVQSAVTHTNQEEIVEKIKQSTMGYPLNNILIAQALIDPAAWDACGEKLFEPYPTLTEDDKNAIKALAILHPAARFREEEIEELAPITAGKKLSGSIIRKQLYASNIMSWDRGGWLIEEAVTDFFRAQLVFDPHIKKRHQELHTQALSMYERWQNEEQNPQAYKQEISYHRDRVSA